MKTIIFSLLFVIPFSAHAGKIDDLAATETEMQITPGELHDALTAKERRGFEIVSFEAKSFFGNPDHDPLALTDLRCILSQYKELKKVNWSRFNTTAVEVSLTTKFSPFAGEVKTELENFDHDDDPRYVRVAGIKIEHSVRGCSFYTAAEIERKMDEAKEEARKIIRERNAKERRQDRDADARDRLLESLEKDAKLRVPASDCADPRVACREVSRKPAFILDGNAKAALELEEALKESGDAR